jgi:hypothetical protein
MHVFVSKQMRKIFNDTVDEYIRQGMPREMAIVNGLHKATELGRAAAQNAIDNGLEMYAVPRRVFDQLAEPARWAGIGGSWTHKYYDSAMAAWRNMVLLGRPAWVMNNFLGNTLFLKMQGGSLIDAMHLLENHYARILNERYGWSLSSNFLDKIEKVPGYKDVGSGFFGLVAQREPYNPAFRDSALGKAINAAENNKGMSLLRSYGNSIRSINSELESAFREASWLKSLERQSGISTTKESLNIFGRSADRIDRLMATGVDETKAALALKEVNNFLGNYTSMTPFERQVVRRFVFPFWGFYRHQIKLLATYPLDYALRTAVLNRLSMATKEFEQEYGPQPSWLQGALPLSPPGTNPTVFQNTKGPNPFQGTFQPWTSQLAPILKIAMEQATGNNAFTNQPFTDANTITPYGSSQSWRIIYDDQGNPVDAIPVDKVVPGLGTHILQQIPQYNTLMQSIAGGRTYDTSNLLDALRGDALMTDSTGAPVKPTTPAAQLMSLTGVTNTTFDLANYQQRLADERKIALDEAIKRAQVA